MITFRVKHILFLKTGLIELNWRMKKISDGVITVIEKLYLFKASSHEGELNKANEATLKFT
jgi:hypothetical protein